MLDNTLHAAQGIVAAKAISKKYYDGEITKSQALNHLDRLALKFDHEAATGIDEAAIEAISGVSCEVERAR